MFGQCIRDYGMFKNEKGQSPTIDDYIFHFTFGMLEACCLNEEIPTIIPRILLNNLAIKLIEKTISMAMPRHQDWSMEIFDRIRSDLVPDFINKMKIAHLVTEEYLINITKK